MPRTATLLASLALMFSTGAFSAEPSFEYKRSLRGLAVQPASSTVPETDTNGPG